MSNVIGTGRFQEGLRRLFRVPAATPIAPTLASEIVPTLELGTPSIEQASLQGIVPCVMGHTVAAVAGQYSRVYLNALPTTGGVMAVVRSFMVYQSAFNQFRFGFLAGTGAAPLNVTAVRDAGMLATQRWAYTLGGGTFAAQAFGGAGTAYGLDYCPGTVMSRSLEIPYVLRPGGPSLVWEGTAVNVSLTVCVVWEERPLQELEGITGL